MVNNMVKKIVSVAILALLVVRLVTFQWPIDLAGIINTASLVIISIAAGIALPGLFRRDDT